MSTELEARLAEAVAELTRAAGLWTSFRNSDVRVVLGALEDARADVARLTETVSALVHGRASVVMMEGPNGKFPAIAFHTDDDPNAEVRDSETEEVIFPAAKAPFRVVKS